MGLGLLVVALGLYWPPSDFRFEYHNDEPSKVEQIVSGTRNLRHPVLMLTVADGVVWVAGVQEDRQAVAWLGRGLSGLALAVAVGTLGATVALGAGWLPGVMAGMLALGRPDFYEASQMFKEDAWHLATVGLAVLVAVAWGREKGAGRAIGWALGFGGVLGLAVSARYYAVVPALLALGWVWVRGGRWWSGVGWTVLGLIGVFLALHLPWLEEVGLARAEVAREIEYFARGHFGVGETVPHDLYWKKLEGMASWFQWGLLGLAAVGLAVRGQIAGLLAGAGAWAYLWVLGWSPKFADRYFLPVEWAWCLGMGLGLGTMGLVALRVMRAYGERVGLGVAVLVMAGAGLWVLGGWWPEVEERRGLFELDDRRELAEWMERNLPGEVRWVEDDLAQIRLWLPGRTVGFAEFVVDLGTAEELVKMGAGYAVLCRDRHYRYTADRQVAQKDEGGVAAMRRERYRRLLEEGMIVWSSPGRHPKVMHPGLDLVDLGLFRAGAGTESYESGGED